MLNGCFVANLLTVWLSAAYYWHTFCHFRRWQIKASIFVVKWTKVKNGCKMHNCEEVWKSASS